MIRPGDLVYVDCDGASYQGYKTCIYRTFCCGKATAEQKALFAEAKEMLYAGMSVVKNGATDHDILAKWPDSPRTGGTTPGPRSTRWPAATASGSPCTIRP